MSKAKCKARRKRALKKAADDSWEIEPHPAFKLAKLPEAALKTYLMLKKFLVLGCSLFPYLFLAFKKVKKRLKTNVKLVGKIDLNKNVEG